MIIFFIVVGMVLLYGILSAKWAMELGYSQFTQIIIFCSALFLGPLVLFFLYIRLLYLRKKNGKSGVQYFGYPKEKMTN